MRSMLPGVVSRCFGQRSVKPVCSVPRPPPTKQASIPNHHPPAHPMPPHTHAVETPPKPARQTVAASSTPFLWRGESSPKVGDAVFGLELSRGGGAGACVGSAAPAPVVAAQPPHHPHSNQPYVIASITNVLLAKSTSAEHQGVNGETPLCSENCSLLSDVCLG